MILTEQQRAFLEDVRYAVVGTLNADGSIQQSVVWYMYEGGEIRFGIAAGSTKARNLRRNPNITLTMEDGQRYLTLSGTAVVEPPDRDLRYRMAVRYLGADRAADWVARSPALERASVRVTITRVYGQGV